MFDWFWSLLGYSPDERVLDERVTESIAQIKGVWQQRAVDEAVETTLVAIQQNYQEILKYFEYPHPIKCPCSEVVGIFGNTGAGKSTLINYLQGSRYHANLSWQDKSVPESMIVGHIPVNPKTLRPHISISQSTELCWIDTPGFLESLQPKETLVQYVGAMFGNYYLTQNMHISDIIFVVQKGELSAKKGFRPTANKISEMLQLGHTNHLNNTRIQQGVHIVVTDLNQTADWLMQQYRLADQITAHDNDPTLRLAFQIVKHNLFVANITDDGAFANRLIAVLQAQKSVLDKGYFDFLLGLDENQKQVNAWARVVSDTRAQLLLNISDSFSVLNNKTREYEQCKQHHQAAGILFKNHQTELKQKQEKHKQLIDPQRLVMLEKMGENYTQVSESCNAIHNRIENRAGRQAGAKEPLISLAEHYMFSPQWVDNKEDWQARLEHVVRFVTEKGSLITVLMVGMQQRGWIAEGYWGPVMVGCLGYAGLTAPYGQVLDYREDTYRMTLRSYKEPLFDVQCEDGTDHTTVTPTCTLAETSEGGKYTLSCQYWRHTAWNLTTTVWERYATVYAEANKRDFLDQKADQDALQTCETEKNKIYADIERLKQTKEQFDELNRTIVNLSADVNVSSTNVNIYTGELTRLFKEVSDQCENMQVECEVYRRLCPVLDAASHLTQFYTEIPHRFSLFQEQSCALSNECLSYPALCLPPAV